jgi:hypothetical protein
VTDRVDCQVFEDQLDALERSELPPEGMGSLRAHAEACAECGARLRLHQHAGSLSLEALEARVPDAWVSSMASDVDRALRTRAAARSAARGAARGGRGSWWRWTVPALAAAVAALLFANGLTLRALRDVEARHASLSEQVLEQQRRLVALEPATTGEADVGPGVASARAYGRGEGLGGRTAWLSNLDGGGEVTVADLRALLRELPASTPLMSASRTSELAGARMVPSRWRAALAGLDTGESVTAGDLLAMLDRLGLPSAARVPTARLLDLLG